MAVTGRRSEEDIKVISKIVRDGHCSSVYSCMDCPMINDCSYDTGDISPATLAERILEVHLKNLIEEE